MNKQEKTLVILTPAFASDEEDNWLPSQAGFVRNLNKVFPSLRVVILAFHFPISKKKRYSWFGNEVIAFSGGMKGGGNSLLRWARVWQTLATIRKQQKLVGIFSFFCSESAFVGHYFSQRHQLKHYIWVLGQDARKDNKQVKRIKPKADELVAISDFLVREFDKNHGIKPAHVIPIGIIPENFSAYSGERDIEIIGAGSLSPIKQYDVFVAVVKEVSKVLPSVKAVICGGGSEYDALNQLIQREGLEQNISLLGERTQQEVIAMMQRSKILLHTSSYEGFGMVCAEALYAGAHVISFCKPMDAVIEQWRIVSDAQGMAAESLALLQDKSLQHKSVLPYKMDDTVRQIMSLYGYGEGA